MSLYHVTLQLSDPHPTVDADESGRFVFGVRDVSVDAARKAVVARCVDDGWLIPDLPIKVEKVGRGDVWDIGVPLCYGKG